MVPEESESDEYWETKLPRDWEVIIKKLEIPNTVYAKKRELFSLLQNGISFYGGKKFFWINDDGKICEAISSEICVDFEGRRFSSLKPDSDSRFPSVVGYSRIAFEGVNFEIKTSMLSLGTMYEASLVFKFLDMSSALRTNKFIEINWRTNGLNVCSTQYPQLTSNNWFTIKMWHFINVGPNTDFDINIKELSYSGESTLIGGVFFQGIEFQPIEMHEDTEGFKSLSISDEVAIIEDDSDEYWEKKLPDGYGVFIKMSDKPLEYTTKKELYLHFCEGFLCNNGRWWVSLCKSTRGICSILRAGIDSDASDYKGLTLPLIGSRFDKVAKLKGQEFRIVTKSLFSSRMFSPQYVYACYLLFKFEHKYVASSDNCLFKVYACELDDIPTSKFWNIPTIKPKNDYGSNDSSNITEGHIEHDINGKIKQREDGWMEVILCNSLRQLQHHETLYISIEVSEDCISSGIIIEGIEFRPRI